MRGSVVGLVWCVLAIGCTGIIDDADKGTRAAYDNAAPGDGSDGDSSSDGTRSGPGTGSGAAADGSGGDGSVSGDGSSEVTTPDGTPVDESSFTYATLGSRCSDGSRKTFVVVSKTQGSCDTHARSLDAPETDDVLRIALDDDDSFDGAVPLCSGGQCSDVDVHLTLDGRSDGAAGSIELDLAGKAVTRSLRLAACDYDSVVPPPRDALAKDVSIRELAIYQGVKVSLAANGTPITTRNAPVVANRPALVRAFVDTLSGFSPRTLIGRLELSTAGGEPKVLESKLDLSGASSDPELGSTFNFDLTPDLVGPDTQYAVSIQEAEACGSTSTGAAASRVPATGASALQAADPGDAFRVVVVPVRYTADGSNRTPSVDANAVSSLRNALFNMFPVADVQVSVRAPMDWDVDVLANGNGWSELLDQCLAQRDADNVDPKVYYYCMFNPAAGFGEYCRGGCVAGLGPVASAGDSFRRGSIGLGFGDPAGTMAHELGHALGRPHAPCGGAAGPDPGFPYSGGTIGSWGYDLSSKALLSPSDHTDLMGYCAKPWISDYNFNLVFKRMQSVYTAPRLRGAPTDLLSIVVDADLSLHVGHHLTLSGVPEGELVRVRFVDAADGELMSAEGSYVAVTHVSGGIVYVPEPPPGSVRVSIEGFGELTL